MDDNMRRRAAYRGFVGDDDTEYFLYLKGDEVLIAWQWGDEDNGGSSEQYMSVTDLKRLVGAAQSLLKITGNDAPLPPPGRPETDNISAGDPT